MTGVFVTEAPNSAAPPIPVPSPASTGEVWDASRTLARGDRMDAEQERLHRAYEPLLGAINADRVRRGLKPMVNPGLWVNDIERRGSTDNGFDLSALFGERFSRGQQQAAIFAELRNIRARQPNFLKTVPADERAFNASIIENEKAARTKARDVLGRSSGIIQGATQFGAGVFETMHDPVNIASLPLGGGGKTIAQQVVRSILVNGALEAVQQPIVAEGRARLGEELTLSEAATNIGFAAVGGVIGDVALPQGAKALGRATSAAFDAVVPLDVRAAHALGRATLDGVDDGEIARAFSKAVPSEIRTPDETAAIHVATRQADVDGVNPFMPSPAGMDAHAARLQASMEAVLNANTGAPGARPIVASEPPRLPTPSNSGHAIASDIVQFFQAKGYSDAQARGIAAGIEAEASSNHGALNPTSGAYGLGQWLGPRKKALFARFGQNPTRAQQLEFLHSELQGGDPGGRAVLAQGDEGAVLDAYIKKFMRPAAGAETDGDLSRGLSALGREPREMAQAASPGEAEPILRPAALDAARPIIGPSGNRLRVEQFSPDEIGVDAALMQFKSGGDAQGVTDRLQGVADWDPLAAGTVTVWEGLDGRRLIADGHQRLGLAQRIRAADPSADIAINAFVLREADGITADEARLVTALKNIGEGTGTASDAAKIFRNGGADAMERLSRRLPPRSPLVRDGKALARLSPEAFGAVINDVIPESWGAVIGDLAPDPVTHEGMVSLLAKLHPANRRQAEGIIRQALQAGFSRETQTELFGGRDTVTSLFLDRARVLDRSLAELSKLKNVFSLAARNAETLESAGSSIAVSASERSAADSARALALIERLAYSKGHVADLLNASAKRLADGEPIGSVVRSFVADVRKLDITALDREAGSSVGSGSAADGSGRGGIADDGSGRPSQADDGELTPATRDELEAAGQGGFDIFDSAPLKAFDDPAGAGAKAQADSLAHDARAELDAPDMFGGATAADKRTALERAGEGRAQAGVAQKSPGSDGGLFDVQAQDMAFRLDVGDERTVADLLSEIDADQAAIDAVRGCL